MSDDPTPERSADESADSATGPSGSPESAGEGARTSIVVHQVGDGFKKLFDPILAFAALVGLAAAAFLADPARVVAVVVAAGVAAVLLWRLGEGRRVHWVAGIPLLVVLAAFLVPGSRSWLLHEKPNVLQPGSERLLIEAAVVGRAGEPRSRELIRFDFSVRNAGSGAGFIDEVILGSHEGPRVCGGSESVTEVGSKVRLVSSHGRTESYLLEQTEPGGRFATEVEGVGRLLGACGWDMYLYLPAQVDIASGGFHTFSLVLPRTFEVRRMVHSGGDQVVVQEREDLTGTGLSRLRPFDPALDPRFGPFPRWWTLTARSTGGQCITTVLDATTRPPRIVAEPVARGDQTDWSDQVCTEALTIRSATTHDPIEPARPS